METQAISSFNIIGIAIRTSNDPGKASVDIPSLWNRFMSEGVLEKVSNRTDDAIYCVYTDYEKDHTAPYTTILGCRVLNVDIIPDGMVVKTIKGGNFSKFSATGNLLEGAVFQEWAKIWQTDLPRLFTADFEVYGEKAQNSLNGEVDIFIAVQE